MTQDITLDSLTPRLTTSRKTFLTALLISISAVLVFTWVWIGINPFQLYEKKDNAMEYLFGRILSIEERSEARRLAERFPSLIASEEARSEIMKSFAEKGQRPDSMKLARMISLRAESKLAVMTPEKKQEIVEVEYERILDEKKGGFFPPETNINHLKAYFQGLMETIAIAIWGSIFAVLAAIPASFFAASNTLEILFQGESPALQMFRRSCYIVTRRFLDFCRGFNEFVMALIFVAVIGLGPFAGVLALAIHTFGVLGKVFSEAIETIESGQIEGVVAGGARPVQVISFSVLPQVMPLIVSYSLLRFESNVRSATILGFVGAGGIGFLMFDKLNGYQYREVATMMIMVIISVSVIDYFCGKLRSRFI